MLRKLGLLVSIIVLGTHLSACQSSFFDEAANITGAIPIVEDEKGFRKVDLPTLLDPEDKGASSRPKDKKPPAKDPAEEGPGSSGRGDEQPADFGAPEEEAVRRSLEYAYVGFYADTDSDDQKARRNRVVSRLISASNDSCSNFQKKLNRLQSDPNFLLGVLTTGLAGAGAVVTGMPLSNILAAGAAFTSGVRAEYNSTYFREKTVEVITRGIDQRRERILVELTDNFEKEIDEYPVELAVGDVNRYHGACSLIEGLEEVSEVVTVANDPGLKRLQEIFDKIGVKSTFKITTGDPEDDAPDDGEEND